MTLSLAAVFIPVLFMGGVLGRLFREFSVTICVAILISGVVSVTLTPMLCSRFLKRPHAHGEGSQRVARSTTSPNAGSSDCSASTIARCRSSCGTARRRWRVRTRADRDRRAVRRSCRRASFRTRTPSQISVITEAAQGTGVRQARRVSGPGRRDHPARTRTSRGWCRRSAAAAARRSAGRISARSS